MRAFSDYDPAAAPQLITVNHNGEKIDAVTIAGKHGFMFAFECVTGEPLWPIEERAVPQSHVPGEEAWPTQPYPTTLPPFERQDISPDDITPFFLSDEERTEWKDKVAQLKENDRTGLFVPLSDKYETIAVPGAVGGASWGNTASNPEKGLVYVISINWPSIYPPLEKRSFSNDASQSQNQQSWVNPIAQGQNVYRQYCQACHGEDHRGTGIGTSLIGIEARLNREAFQQVVGSGRGEMPSFSYISQQDISSIYRYLGGSQDGNIVTVPDGPVVATGGIEGSQTYRPTEGGGLLGSDYPEGVDAPDTRYYLDGWGLGHAYIMSPPWSSITAYDLNEGGIKWQRPLGEDKMAALEGGKDTGVPRSQRNGMIVTSTGLLFSTAKDGKVRAFDADNGEELWSAQLPTGTEGIPAMYEVDGKNYLVVTSTTPLRWGTGEQDYDEASIEEKPQGGYVVFSLPE